MTKYPLASLDKSCWVGLCNTVVVVDLGDPVAVSVHVVVVVIVVVVKGTSLGGGRGDSSSSTSLMFSNNGSIDP